MHQAWHHCCKLYVDNRLLQIFHSALLTICSFSFCRKYEDFTIDEHEKPVNPTIARVRFDFYNEKRLQRLNQIDERIYDMKLLMAKSTIT